MTQFYILNRTPEVQVLVLGGSLGVLQLSPYEAKAVDEKQLNVKVQEMINKTLKKVVICDEVPDKYIRLAELAKNPSLQSADAIINNSEKDENKEGTPSIKFTKTALKKKSVEELEDIALSLGYAQSPTTKKELIETILTAQEG